MTKVKLVNVRKGKRDPHKHTTYAQVVDAETGELMIGATLEYCLEKIKERNLILIEDEREKSKSCT